MVFDFESAVTLTGFGGAEDSAVVTDPTDASNHVARITKSETSETWAGVTMSACEGFSIAPLPFTATETTMSLRVWSPAAGTVFRLKAENAEDPTVTVETEAVTSSAKTWETITFDFADEAKGTAALDPTDTYSKVSVFPNFGVAGADAGALTWYVDDLTFLGTVYDTTCPDPGGDGGSDEENLLANPGFEDGWDGSWLIYPETLTNYAISATGDAIYDSSDTFSALGGTNGLKVYGQYTGWQNETPIYQQFAASPGQTYTLSGYMYHHPDDAIQGTQTYAALAIKFFTADYSGFSMSETEHFTSSTATDAWTELSVTAAVPEGFTIVQAAIEYWHCYGEAEGDCYDGGSVYVDDLVFTVTE